MSRTFLFSLFYCLVLQGASQWSNPRSDSSLWASPLSPEKAVQNNIKQVIVRQKQYHRVNWTTCRDGEIRLKFGVVKTIYELDSLGYPAAISVRGVGKDVKYAFKNEYKNGLLVKSGFDNGPI